MEFLCVFNRLYDSLRGHLTSKTVTIFCYISCVSSQRRMPQHVLVVSGLLFITKLLSATVLDFWCQKRFLSGKVMASSIEKPGKEVMAKHNLAKSREEVIAAWQLVYRAYLIGGLIDPNPYLIHLVAEAVRPSTKVIVGKSNGVIISTATCYLDNDLGIPLDHTHHHLLNGFREAGHKLMEVGLLAYECESTLKSINAMVELMRYILFYGIHAGATDLVFGVPPHRINLYKRYFAFDALGEVTGCPSANNNPMVLLRANIYANLELEPRPKGIKMLMDKPLSASEFKEGFCFDSDSFNGTVVAAYLAATRALS